jgi:hypothetical protein
MIGDTTYDAEAGLGAGAAAAGVLTGGFPKETLIGAGCFAVAADLEGLLPSLRSGAPATPLSAIKVAETPLRKRAWRF